VSKADFRIDFKPGMLVVKGVHSAPSATAPRGSFGQETFYRLDANGGWNEVSFVGGKELPSWGPWWLWLGLAIALFAVIGGVVYRRMRRRGLAGGAPTPAIG
jgi:hypothetical protein